MHYTLFLISCLVSSLLVFFTSAPAYSERIMQMNAEPGAEVTVECRASVGQEIAGPVRGLFFTDHIDNRLIDSLYLIETYILFEDEQEFIDIPYEPGAANAIYDGAAPFRMQLESPPVFEENMPVIPGSTLVIRYKVTVPIDAHDGETYLFPGYCWAGMIEPEGEPSSEDTVFGYEEDTPATLTVVSQEGHVGTGYPHRDIMAGIKAVGPGGTVYVHAGSYDGFTVPVTRTGVVVQSAPGEEAIVDGIPVIHEDISAAVCISADNTTIQGLTLGTQSETTYISTVFVNNARNTTIAFNNIYNGESGNRLNITGPWSVDARNNYWGVSDSDEISGMITGTADYSPCLVTGFAGAVETGCILPGHEYEVDILSTIDLSAGTQNPVTVTFASYSSEPIAGIGFGPGASYFDIFSPDAGTAGAITLTMCAGVDTATEIRWHDSSQWMDTDPEPVFSEGCLQFTVSASSEPSLLDLAGTVFAVGKTSQPTSTATTTVSSGGNGGGGGGGSGVTSTTSIQPVSTTSTTSLPYQDSTTTSTVVPHPPPVLFEIISAPGTTALAGRVYTYQVEIQGGQGSISFTIDTAPDGMKIDESTGLIEWRPAFRQRGMNDVTIKVLDESGAVVTQNFSIEVTVLQKCPADAAAENDRQLHILRSFRDGPLSADRQGRKIIDVYYEHSAEISDILTSDSTLRLQSGVLLRLILPVFEERLQAKQAVRLTSDQFNAIITFIEAVKEKASVSCSNDISLLQEMLITGEFSDYVLLPIAE